MASRTGSARLTLFLLCCTGTWLASHLTSIHEPPAADRRKIISMLEKLSWKLLEGYLAKEKGVQETKRYSLPCSTAPSQPADLVNSSAIMPYFQAIKPLLPDLAEGGTEPPLSRLVDEIIEQLDKLKAPHEPETTVALPPGNFQQKSFIVTILKRFLKCMQVKSALLNPGTQRVM
ncbi:interleukin-31 [Talpa occidentalis]|uniref:interleukin-31 n=1 Tax=Talpa occidentalis TaxID=50954 RepID=UPI00188E4FED|nr:interleukin-31 [Talpa occidentalis]